MDIAIKFSDRSLAKPLLVGYNVCLRTPLFETQTYRDIVFSSSWRRYTKRLGLQYYKYWKIFRYSRAIFISFYCFLDLRNKSCGTHWPPSAWWRGFITPFYTANSWKWSLFVWFWCFLLIVWLKYVLYWVLHGKFCVPYMFSNHKMPCYWRIFYYCLFCIVSFE